MYIYIYIYLYIYDIYIYMQSRNYIYQHNSFVSTHALGHLMYGYILLVPMTQKVLKKLSKEHNISD